jgi:mycofactocin system glycosyltransferase
VSAPAGRRHALDRWVRRDPGGRVLAGGAPGRLVRLSPAGAQALDQLLAGGAPAAAAPLRDRLRGHGMLHPVADPAHPSPAPVTFVIPSRDSGAGLAALVTQLRAWGPVIVADDGSSDGSAELAVGAGATVIANSGRRGPAGARNAGLAAAGTEYVAFLDVDCRCAEEWASPLAALLDEEPELAIAAPRVRSAAEPGAIAAYERALSPLDMGPHPCRCGPGRRVAYVPSAAMVVRRRALLGLGGFDEELRFGEDVDLCLRLDRAGWAVRYAPEIEVEHSPRSSLRAFAAQRFDYGSSAAPLDRRHPGRVAPLLLNRHSAAVLAAAAIGAARSPRSAVLAIAAVGAASTAVGASRGGGRSAAVPLASLALRGHALAGRQLARTLVRDWLPLTLAACALLRGPRRLAAIAVAVDLGAASARFDSRPRGSSIALHCVDRIAYAAGLWSGAVRERTIAAALPRWPSKE